MTTVRKKLLIEEPDHIYLKYLEMAIDHKSRFADTHSRWHDMSDDQLANIIYEKTAHKET